MRYLLLLLLSCQTVGQVPGILSDVPPDFKKTMKVSVNGKKIVGAGTVPMSRIYKIEAIFPAKPELVKISTCHKQLVFENPTASIFDIGVAKSIENEGYCPIRIDSIDLGGVNGSAIIEIENETLDASLMCDGVSTNTIGVNICQAKAGLVQRILFFDKVTWEKMSDDCADLVPIGDDYYGFDFNISRGECVYIFYAKDVDKFHRLTTFGYSDVFINSVKPGAQ